MDGDAAADIQHPDPLRAVKLVRGSRQHVNIVFRYIDRNMADCLYSIHMKQHALLPADRTDLSYGLDRTDLIVRVHDSHQTGIVPDGFCRLLRNNQSILMHIQKGDLKALLLQL